MSDILAGWLDGIGTHWLARLDGLPAAAEPLDPGLPIARLDKALALDVPITDLIELLLAIELHEELARRVLAAGPAGLPFALARRMIPGLTPVMLACGSAARRFEVIVMEGAPRTLASIRLAEAMLDRLCGGTEFDPAIETAIRPMPVEPDPMPGLAEGLGARGTDGLSPIIALPDHTPDAAAAGLAALGLKPYRLRPSALPETAEARARWARLWARDAAIDGAVLVTEIPSDPAVATSVAEILDALLGHAIITGAAPAGAFMRPVRVLWAPASADPAARWRRAFGADVAGVVGGAFEAVARRFRLDHAALDRLAFELGPRLLVLSRDQAAQALWRAAARAVPANQVPGVRMVEPAIGWDDIVLPGPLAATLRRIETHVRHAHQVMVDWGFARAAAGRGTGVAALFHGASGTGKTMAAEMLADALGLRMMLIDISQITSKYIGETSKNVAAAFIEAERTGAVMVWNEGDAIWGARGTVGSATDRHVNAEIGDLLQRIEAFTGFTIVTTNLKAAIDPAFLRRFRFIAEFTLPGTAEREAIWRRVFPAAAPVAVAEDEWSLLATVAMSGGSIRNAALGAAFAAAAEGSPISLGLIAEEVAAELRKTGQPMPVLIPSRAAAA